MKELSRDSGLVDKTVKFNCGADYSWIFNERSGNDIIGEGLVIDKILISRKGVHETGMFHWKKDYPYSILEEVYLIQIDEPFGNTFQGYDENGKGYGSKQTYRKKSIQINPDNIMDIITQTEKL